MIRTILARAIMVAARGRARSRPCPRPSRRWRAASAIALGDYLELDDGVLWGAMHTWEGRAIGPSRTSRARIRARALLQDARALRRAGERPRDASTRWRVARDMARRGGLDPDVYVGLDVATDAPFGARGGAAAWWCSRRGRRGRSTRCRSCSAARRPGALAGAARHRARAPRAGHACARSLSRTSRLRPRGRRVRRWRRRRARAEGVDPSYGRVEGDLTLVAGVGRSRWRRADRARRASCACVTSRRRASSATYEDGPIVGSSVRSAPRGRRGVRAASASFSIAGCRATRRVGRVSISPSTRSASSWASPGSSPRADPSPRARASRRASASRSRSSSTPRASGSRSTAVCAGATRPSARASS